MSVFPDEPTLLSDLPRATALGPKLRGVSADRKRTLRNQAALDRGIHPATRVRLLVVAEDEPAKTCGGCAHRVANGRYWKCGLVPITGGAGTDIRLKWPACVRYEPENEEGECA